MVVVVGGGRWPRCLMLRVCVCVIIIIINLAGTLFVPVGLPEELEFELLLPKQQITTSSTPNHQAVMDMGFQK